MGVRVNPGEVEELFYGSGLLEEIAVFGVQHDLLGHEIWAAVVPKHGVTQKQLEQFAKTNLSVFMLPRRYLIKDSLPKTPTRKTDYVSLRVEAVSNASRSFA
jgi:acyl-CoA synthetase (AMP-forming)/AMP-acid ligase II